MSKSMSNMPVVLVARVSAAWLPICFWQALLHQPPRNREMSVLIEPVNVYPHSWISESLAVCYMYRLPVSGQPTCRDMNLTKLICLIYTIHYTPGRCQRQHDSLQTINWKLPNIWFGRFVEFSHNTFRHLPLSNTPWRPDPLKRETLLF